MTGIKRIHKFQSYLFKKSALTFWAVLVVINVFFYSLNRFFNSGLKFGIFRNGQLVSIVGVNFMPILIFFVINGIIIYHENFRLALNFGVIRKDFYKSVIVINLISALIFSLVQTMFQLIDRIFIKNIGMNPVVAFQFYNNPLINSLALFMSFTSILIFIASLVNIIGILQYKYSYKFWIGFGIFIFLSRILLGTIIPRFIFLLKGFFSQMALQFGIFSLPILSIILSSIFYLIGYMLFTNTEG